MVVTKESLVAIHNFWFEVVGYRSSAIGSVGICDLENGGVLVVGG
jgi:hypothetical protein